MESVLESIPDSKLPSPEGFRNKFTYLSWKVITPGFLWGQNLLLKLRLIKHNGRQNYLLGHLAPGVDMADLLCCLRDAGWKNHFIAWEDDDQVVSIRILEDFSWQYHLRIFKDGEVRGHYERTPEAHPILHLKKEGQAARHEHFFKYLSDYIVPVVGAMPILPIQKETVGANMRKSATRARGRRSTRH